MAQLQNQYGYFSDDGTEYIITRPDTPMPWVNVIANDDYGLVISQAGSGYSWRTHASLNRITRWEQDLIRDEWGKYLYLRDVASGDFWSPTWQPCGVTLDDYRVRHGMGYSVFEARREKLHSSLSVFVPLNAPCEIWLLRLENHGDTTRHLQIFTYLEWLLGVAPDWHREFHRTFIDTRYDSEAGVLLASKVLWELPVPDNVHWNRSWPYVAFLSSSLKARGFDTDKRDFIGRNGTLRQPAAVVSGTSHNRAGRWGDPIGSLLLEISLPPGENREIVFTLGAADSVEHALTLINTYKEPAAAHADLKAAREYWQSITSRLVIETPDQALNLMGNGWLQYQTISGRLKGRTAYYQTGGAYGFRDQLQDSLIWLLLGYPEKTLDQIRLHAAHQYQDGIVLHWWHPLAETGLRSDYSDDLLWLPFAVYHYVQETGNFACLEEEIPFYDEGAASLREHCQRAFEVALTRRSERGLPFILKGDWNDGLNAVGAEGRGESVWTAHFLHYLLRAWIELPLCNGDTASQFRREADQLRAAINEFTWDGAWYQRATRDNGDMVGSHQSREGRIFLNAQTWAILSGSAPEDRAAQAMSSARQHLYSAYGPLLLAPAYTKPDPEIGYLSRYAPGVRENGGVYCHAACWAVLAEGKLNGAQAAYELWRSFCPSVRGQDPDQYLAEPYVMPGNVTGPLAMVPGQGGWTWYTGAAAWYLRALIDGVLGIEANVDGIKVRGMLPDNWDQFRIKRWFRGAVYDITVRRGSAETGCYVNGEHWPGDFLPIAESGTIQVVLHV
jgi:cellobiose phosphorylase